ncbi:GGDEF domain protein [hydrothermal vent metagenome]|uniref:GGDEF domain protein n=1 Tax=hydrothermal vent metagenome TaxID=652676 RepID=A0A1W1BGF9_9ZZZZ
MEKTEQLFTLSKITKLSNELQIDTLTGVYKKSYFNTQLEKMMREHEALILVVIDIDDFKAVNDTYGHQSGDTILIEFTRLIQANIRTYDMFSRWGGEEFLLLFRHTNLENAIKKLERLRKIIEEHNFSHISSLTASFGLSLRNDNDDVHSLVERADLGLYEAKKSGKNRVIYKAYPHPSKLP